MREIKFRARDERGFWAKDFNLSQTGDILCSESRLRYEGVHKTKLYLMQYTNQKDKSGKEIYEGDIVVQNSYPWFTDEGKPNYRGVIEWYYSSWNVSAQSVNSDNRGMAIGRGLNDDGLDEGATSDWEIIGNIYENPELLNN